MTEFDVARRRQLVRAAVMYYLEGSTQQQIAHHLRVSRATAGRLVASARAEGIVRVEISPGISREVEIERALELAYGLEEAVVVNPADVHQGGSVDLGQGCADILQRRLMPGMTVGLGWSSDPNEWIGRTAEVLQAAARRQSPTPEVTVVQMAGAAPDDPRQGNPMRTVSAVADALGAQEILVAAPLYVRSPHTARNLLADRGIAAAMAAVERANICMFGVGHVTATTPLVRNGYLDIVTVQQLQSLGAVGDLCGRFYDADGEPVRGDLAECTIAATIPTIARSALRVAIAAGPERVESLRACLTARLANAVVTDTPTAQAMLRPAANTRTRPSAPLDTASPRASNTGTKRKVT